MEECNTERFFSQVQAFITTRETICVKNHPRPAIFSRFLREMALLLFSAIELEHTRGQKQYLRFYALTRLLAAGNYKMWQSVQLM